MKKSKVWILMLLMLSLMVGLTACGGDDSSTEATSEPEATSEAGEESAEPDDAEGTETDGGEAVDLRIGYFPNITHAQALVLKDQGKVEEAVGDNVNVSWTSFNAGPAEIESIFAGEIDLGYIGPIPAINAYEQSEGDVNIIANASDGGAVLVTRKDLVLEDAKDLDGKKVAIPQLGNTQHLSLLNILKENDLKTVQAGGTVDVVAVENAQVQQLMDSGELDAALVPEPWGSVLEKEIGANLFLDYKEVWMNGEYPVALVICSKDFKTEHPDVVEKFLAAHKEATLFINENLDEAKEIVNRQIKEASGKDTAADILDAGFSRMTITEVLNEDAVFAFAEVNKQEGFIKEVPDEQIIDTSLLK